MTSIQDGSVTEQANTKHFNQWWNTTLPGHPSPTTKIQCRECRGWSSVGQWEECEPYCEDCGDHDGIRCPMCQAEFDHVWGASTPFLAQLSIGAL